MYASERESGPAKSSGSPSRLGSCLRTLVCSDVVGFTSLLEELGDEHALAAMERHDEIVRDCTRENGGRVRELRGDGFLLSFRSPTAAVACASAIQCGLAAERRALRGPRIHVRIGAHSGSILFDGSRYFGLAMVVPFRLAEAARCDEILISDALRRRIESGTTCPISASGPVALKGIEQPLGVARVIWRSPPPAAPRRPRTTAALPRLAGRGSILPELTRVRGEAEAIAAPSLYTLRRWLRLAALVFSVGLATGLAQPFLGPEATLHEQLTPAPQRR